MIVDPRVVEIIDRFPALARRHLIRFERAIEILGAVHMARIADIVIIAAVAGGGEEVMPPDRVLHLRSDFAAGRANDEETVALRREALPIAGRRCGAEQPDRLGLAEIDPAPREGLADARCGFAVAGERRPEAAGLVCCPDIQ